MDENLYFAQTFNKVRSLNSLSTNNSEKLLFVLYAWVGIIVRNLYFPLEAYQWYSGKTDLDGMQIPFTSNLFIKIMKILINK